MISKEVGESIERLRGRILAVVNEIINVSFSGYCVSCALDTKDHRKASYLLPKEVILEGLKRVMGDDPGLVALTKLSQRIKKMP